MVGKDKIIVQNGVIEVYHTTIALWMGTPPPEEDFEPKERMRMSWNRILCDGNVNLTEEFPFEVTTREGAKFTGEALLLGGIERHGKYISSDSCIPIVINFKEVFC